jgi:hypothetical protein
MSAKTSLPGNFSTIDLLIITLKLRGVAAYIVVLRAELSPIPARLVHCSQIVVRDWNHLINPCPTRPNVHREVRAETQALKST